MPWIKHLVLSHLKLVNVPTLPPNLETLDLSFNILRQVPILPNFEKIKLFVQ